MKYNVFDVQGNLLGHVYANNEDEAVAIFQEQISSAAYSAKPHPEELH